MNVNVSYVQILQGNVERDILDAIQKYSLQPECLCVEMTESGFMDMTPSFCKFRKTLDKNRIPFVIDDFGTGYSNFHYLYNLKPDYIKIDRTLMKNALSNEYENMLLKHMVDMAHSVGVKICIEGIEEKEELERIMLLKPDYIQGFYYGRPVSLSVFMESYEI